MNTNLAYNDWKEKERVELIDGKTVMMSPRPAFNHNRIAFNIAVLFEIYLRGKTCTAIADGTDLYLSEKDRFVPDVMIVCDRNKIKRDGVHGVPDLVVEVLSPGTAKYDKVHKKDIYAKCGVREYWIVSPGDRTVEIYQNNDGDFSPPDVYTVYPDWMLEQMTEEERCEVAVEFKCSLYDDLIIRLDDIFHNLI